MKTVLLDLGGVVFNSTGKDSNKINWKVISELNEKYGYELDIGKGIFQNFLDEYNLKTNQNLSEEEFLKSIFDTLEFNSDLVDFLKNDYKIVILSDNYRDNINYISKRYNFLEWSSEQFYSYDFKMTKSNKTIFSKVLEKLGVEAKDCIFIDDDKNNVENAKSLGISSILYKNNEETFNTIHSLEDN
jgi:putative hydrolase of the HAD superfamily